MTQLRTTPRRLAKRIKELRLAKRLSQEELAARAGMHKNYLGGIERAERNPSLKHIARLADALEVTIPELFSLLA